MKLLRLFFLLPVVFFVGCTNPISEPSPAPSKVEKPVFNLLSGTYSSVQSITIFTSTVGAQIRYTLDGTIPTSTTGIIFSSGISISSTTTIKAIAVKTGMIDSDLSVAEFTINIPIDQVISPSFSIPSGKFGSDQFVGLSSDTPGASIKFTIDDSDPRTSASASIGNSVAIIGAANMESTLTIRAYAYKSGMTDSTTSSSAYVIDKKAPAEITGLVVTPGNSQTTLSWINPTDADFSGVEITSTPLTSTFTNSTNTITINGLQNRTPYAFVVKSVDCFGNKSSGVTSSFQTPLPYEVIFDNQGATVSAIPSLKDVNLPTTLIDSMPTLPTRIGYIFGGWWTGKNGLGNEFTIGTNVASNMTVYAKWNPAVITGFWHSIVVKSDGSLKTTGANYNGQLGSTTPSYRTTLIALTSNPVNVSAGSNHTLIVKNDNTLWVTGANSYGQLGNGSQIDVKILSKIMDNVRLVSGGCWYSMILKTDGSLWATGDNSCGQLGDGTTSQRISPVNVMADVADVSCGNYHSLILKKDGTLYVTGKNVHGQLGDGTTNNRLLPYQISSDVIAIAAGGDHSMFIKSDSSLWAMGYNNYGQLGNNSTADILAPIKILDSVRYVSSGRGCTLIIKSDNTLWGTGDNYYGQLCNSLTAELHIPTQVQIDVAVASASGGNHALFMKTDGSLYSVGYNFDGQLGTGNTTGRSIPYLLSY